MDNLEAKKEEIKINLNETSYEIPKTYLEDFFESVEKVELIFTNGGKASVVSADEFFEVMENRKKSLNDNIRNAQDLLDRM